MGQAIAASVAERPDLELAGVWARDEDIDKVVAAADVVIDFSLPEGTSEVIAASVRHQKPLVCGVSGLSDAQIDALDEAARKIVVVYDRNMSLGIAVLERSVREAAESLGLDFDVQISKAAHLSSH